jgi:1-pyrroline-5-carboxylate dehydrogenase
MPNILKVCFLLFVYYTGTNDKAGGPHYVLRWTSPQAIKETFVPLKEWKYQYMSD